jgi:hypothetical protein
MDSPPVAEAATGGCGRGIDGVAGLGLPDDTGKVFAVMVVMFSRDNGAY